MKRKTAQQLQEELEADPVWRARRAEQERALAERDAAAAADEAELVAEIRAAGYDVDSVYDLVNNAPHAVLPRRFVGPYPAAYPVLVRHLELPHVPVIREGIIRALTVKDGGSMVQEALLAAFEREAYPPMRWVLANALQTAMSPHRRRKHPEISTALKTGGQPTTA